MPVDSTNSGSRCRWPAAITASLVALAMTVAAAGCDSTGPGEDTTSAPSTAAGGARVLMPGKLTVCTQMAYRPLEFNKDGKVVGFDVDIVDVVARDLGLEPQYVNVPFDQITTGAVFKTKKCDLAAAGIIITPARSQVLRFSTPYLDATQALLVRVDSGIKSLPGLRGRKVGVQAGTTGLDFAHRHQEANGYRVVVFDDLPLIVNAVTTGRVDAAINDTAVFDDFAKNNPQTDVIARFRTGEQYGLAAGKDANSVLLMTKIDATLSAARADGTYTKIHEKWFGAAPEATAPPKEATSSATSAG